MDERQRDEIGEILSEHSNEGTLHLLSSAYHFLTSRLIYQQIWKDRITEADFDRLSEEAWLGFVYPGLTAYHTWLVEVTDPETASAMRDTMENELVQEVLADWNVWVSDSKLDWLAEFST